MRMFDYFKRWRDHFLLAFYFPFFFQHFLVHFKPIKIGILFHIRACLSILPSVFPFFDIPSYPVPPPPRHSNSWQLRNFKLVRRENLTLHILWSTHWMVYTLPFNRIKTSQSGKHKREWVDKVFNGSSDKRQEKCEIIIAVCEFSFYFFLSVARSRSPHQKESPASEQLKPTQTPALCHMMAVYLYKIGNTACERARMCDSFGDGFFVFVCAFHGCISFFTCSFIPFSLTRSLVCRAILDFCPFSLDVALCAEEISNHKSN